MFFALLKQYWQVSLLRQSPADTPISSVLLLLSGFLFYLIVTTQWNMIEIDIQLTVAQTMLAGAFLVMSYTLYTYILLAVFHVKARFRQTLTCMFAAHSIIHVFAYPLLFAAYLLAVKAIPQSFIFLFMVLYLLLTIGVTVWQLMVTVWIYKQALNVNHLQALLATIGLFAANILVVSIVR